MATKPQRPGRATTTASEEARPGPPHPPSVLLAAAICAVGIAVVLIAGLIVSRYPFAFDRSISAALRGAGPGWLRRAMLDITVLGDVTILTMAVVGGMALLLARRMWRHAALLAGASISGAIVVTIVKTLFARARPPLAERLIEVHGMSFPSGHAADSAIVYFSLAAVGAAALRTRTERNTAVLLAVLLVGAIGVSRIYLAVHWPSDVLAGWSFGTLWALGWWRLGASLARGEQAPRGLEVRRVDHPPVEL